MIVKVHDKDTGKLIKVFNNSKLFLNSVYGKMASSEDNSFKYDYVKDDKTMCFKRVSEGDKKARYIPVGSAITSYARNFTIVSAQDNYNDVNEMGLYTDTDSIPCSL